MSRSSGPCSPISRGHASAPRRRSGKWRARRRPDRLERVAVVESAHLDPDVVLRADQGPVPARVPREFRGAEAVASRAMGYARLDLELQPRLVNGVAGLVVMRDGEPVSVGAITVRNRRIVAMDTLADTARLRELDLTVLDE